MTESPAIIEDAAPAARNYMVLHTATGALIGLPVAPGAVEAALREYEKGVTFSVLSGEERFYCPQGMLSYIREMPEAQFRRELDAAQAQEMLLGKSRSKR